MSASAIPPAALAAAVAATRTFLRMEEGAEAALLERVAATAIGLGEAYTGTLFVRRAVAELRRAGAGWMLLAEAPVSAIDAVTLPGGAALAAGGYALDVDADARGWVRVTQPGVARVEVSYRAGLAETWDTLPAPLAQGAVMLAAHLFEDRAGNARPPAAVAALWRPFRRLQLAVPEHAA